MFNVTHIHTFLSHVALQELALFIGVLIALAIATSLIRALVFIITKAFPTRRMTLLSWMPFINFTIYFIGFFSAAYLIFQPTEKVYLGFIASALIAFGFAAKDILQSLIAGIVVLVDKPFQVGDRVTFQDAYGEIVSIGLRSVKLLTLDESIVTIPNHRFMNDVVSSSSAGQLGMMVTIDMHVAPTSDLVQVKNILEKTASQSKYVHAQKSIVVVAREILGITGVVSIAMRTKCIIKDARTEKAFQTQFIMDVNKELKNQGIRA
ncbi:MAG: mechanosensitive ion channel family protein [Candidatus Babeliales bacterium]